MGPEKELNQAGTASTSGYDDAAEAAAWPLDRVVPVSSRAVSPAHFPPLRSTTLVPF